MWNELESTAGLRSTAGRATWTERTTALGGGADTGDVSGAPTPIDRPSAVAVVTVAQVSTADDQ